MKKECSKNRLCISSIISDKEVSLKSAMIYTDEDRVFPLKILIYNEVLCCACTAHILQGTSINWSSRFYDDQVILYSTNHSTYEGLFSKGKKMSRHNIVNGAIK